MRRRPSFVVVAALFGSLLAGGSGVAVAGTCDGTPAGGDWPVFGRDVGNSRFQPAEDVIGVENVGRLEPAWVFPAPGTIESSPLVAGGCVYIATQTGQVYALDAETGEIVWHVGPGTLSSGSNLSVADGRVFANVSPNATVALDADTGAELWRTTFETDTVVGHGGGSPLAFDGLVMTGLVCNDDAAVGAARGRCRGYYAVLDQVTGEILADGYDVSEEDFANGMGGSGFWGWPAYDEETRHAYLGTANSRTYAPENPISSALLKIDVEPARETFGRVVGHFRDTPVGSQLADLPGNRQVCDYGNNISTCTNENDWVMGSVIYRDSSGRKMVGSGHSTGPIVEGAPREVYTSHLPALLSGHFYGIAADDLSEVWRRPTTGARTAGTAYDGTRLYTADGALGRVLAMDKDTGEVAWTASAYMWNAYAHVSTANGVVYSLSGAAFISEPGPGMLLAWDARDGAPLLQRNMSADIGTPATGTVSAGVTIAANTVFAPMNGVGNGLVGVGAGYLVAYRLP